MPRDFWSPEVTECSTVRNVTVAMPPKNNTLSVPSLLTAVRGVGGFGGAKGVPKDPVSSGENTTKVKCENPLEMLFFFGWVAGMKCILQFFLMT